jgi:glc operon protein GlcG
MDHAPFQSSKLAQDKAYSVAGNGRATHQFWEWIKDDPWLVHNIGQVDGLVALGGGVPVLLGDELIGAVGVSGQSDMAQDRDIAELAAAAIVAAIHERNEPR